MPSHETFCTDLRAPRATSSAVSLVVMITSLLALDGCQVIKGIFEVGFGVGAVVVIAIVAIIGGVIAMMSRKHK